MASPTLLVSSQLPSISAFASSTRASRRPVDVTRRIACRLLPGSWAVPAMRVVGSGRSRAAGRRATLKVVNFHEKEDVHDWRVKQMVTMCHQYFADMWSHGKLEVADEIIGDECVHKNMVWGERLAVGPKAMANLVRATRSAYPDFFVEIQEVAVCDTTCVFVIWSGQATNLGEFKSHRPSYHNSSLSGVTQFRFNKDRSKMTEIVVYRQALYEEEHELRESGMQEDDLHTLHLARLHFEGGEAEAAAATSAGGR